MIAIVHDLVGLLHSNLAVYYAYTDRVPVFIVGATGPMDEAKRRPRSDWTHTAHVQGQAVRDYTKWDYQPATIDGVPENFARAYGVMMTEPRGPDIHVLRRVAAGAAARSRGAAAAARLDGGADSARARSIGAGARRRFTVRRKASGVILVEYAGRDPRAFHALVELAEALGAPVYDTNSRLNSPAAIRSISAW
jgi:acetolactate synthase-1/2/3 large subunit